MGTPMRDETLISTAVDMKSKVTERNGVSNRSHQSNQSNQSTPQQNEADDEH